MATPAHHAPRGTAPPPDIVLEVAPDPGTVIEQLTRGEVDIQVRTARAFPRSLKQFRDYVRQMALLDDETAASCFYALPRDGKTVEGPSIRFAEIVNSAWGHMRVEGRMVDETERYVVSRGTAWDVQQNVIIAYQVRRGIYTSPKKSTPRRYTDDMISVTANAAASIAIRDAILKVVPTPLWRDIWLECKKAAVGDIKTLAKRRTEMLHYFLQSGVTAERVFGVLQIQGEADITLDHLGVLRGLATAIKEGDTNVDDAFPELRPGQGPVQMPQRAERDLPTSPGSSPTPPPASTNGSDASHAPAATPAPVSDPPPQTAAVITITRLEERKKSTGQPYWLVAFSNGVTGCTFSPPLRTRLVEGARYTHVQHHESGGWVYIDSVTLEGGAP